MIRKRPPPAVAGPVFALAFVAAAAALPVAFAQDRRPLTWPEARCARYAEATSEALARFGRDGIGEAFLARHDAFLAAGCRGRRDVCPRSRAELDLANALTVAAMNAGAASSFPPFACRG